jgi:hypothetical protein
MSFDPLKPMTIVLVDGKADETPAGFPPRNPSRIVRQRMPKLRRLSATSSRPQANPKEMRDANPNLLQDRMEGLDARHRGSILLTHPTHACSDHLRPVDKMLIASCHVVAFGNGEIGPFVAMADGISKRSET